MEKRQWYIFFLLRWQKFCSLTELVRRFFVCFLAKFVFFHQKHSSKRSYCLFWKSNFQYSLFIIEINYLQQGKNISFGRNFILKFERKFCQLCKVQHFIPIIFAIYFNPHFCEVKNFQRQEVNPTWKDIFCCHQIILTVDLHRFHD